MELLKLPGIEYCEFKKNDYIIRQDEKIEYIYYLTEGSCYRVSITEKGDEIIYGMKGSNKNHFVYNLVGLLFLFSSGISTSNFIAKSKCYCYRIPKDVFLDYIQGCPQVLLEIVKMAMQSFTEMEISFQYRQEGRVANRLCRFLLKVAESGQDGLRIDKMYGNTEISRFLGMHKITVTKILKVLREEGVIDRDKAGIILLKKDLLQDYSSGVKDLKY